ncbi:hypothetical protein Purlil1_6350 [Purpureocillium lilacinum]|uniref:MYND-type domain-containing protein n=1 Tax=Purpureocillium lilacinum TaxID=33203 RepID=A0ABR0BZT9_PURLI|nr:hypothetical protein Purlil1_6350 [Purpureocillium lilacinum]
MAEKKDVYRAVSSFTGDATLYQELADTICVLAALIQVVPETYLPDDTTRTQHVVPRGSTTEDYYYDDTIDLDVDGLGECYLPSSEDAQLSKLKDELVDRLSETLARFKSPPSPANQDAKHVSSVILIESAEHNTVTFLCAKNEGLDEQDREQFLRGWKDLMEKIARSDRILCSARKLSSDTCPEIEWRPELENLMRSALRLWRSEHGQVALRSWTKRQFTGGSSQQKLFHDSLLYLARIYYAVEVFMEAARKFVCGRSVCYVSAPFLAIQCRRRGRLDPADATSKTLATLVVDKRKISPKVTRDLEQSLPKLYQQNENDRHTHAEIQALYHLEVLFPSQDKTYTVHPYIGCSRRCCFLCKAFVEVTYPEMRRCTERKVRKWRSKLLQTLRDVLKTALLGRVSPKKALAQSSFGLPSEASLEWGRLAKMERAHTKTKRMMMFLETAVDDDFLIAPIPRKPGLVTVSSGQWTSSKVMNLGGAEKLRLNFTRQKHGLEKLDEMPPLESSRANICRFCDSGPALFRCCACRMLYCSQACQRRDWKTHVFVCRVKDRPNKVDNLRWFLKRYVGRDPVADEPELMERLFADDDLCYTFGFNQCVSAGETRYLLFILQHTLGLHKPRDLQRWIDENCLHRQLRESFFLSRSTRDKNLPTNEAFSWYLNEYTTNRLSQPSIYGRYRHQLFALQFVKALFRLAPIPTEWQDLPPKENRVLRLYSRLLQPFNNIPTPFDQEWLLFGFCYCSTHAQCQQLRSAYLQLSARQLPLGHIAEHLGCQEHTIDLFRSQNIDIANLLDQGIRPGLPVPRDVSAYRLVAEVKHALSGRFCSCFHRRKYPRGYAFFENESHLSIPSEIEYGFHGTEEWERWQLLNFYQHVFSLPAFDVGELQAANAANSLTDYLDRLVPDFRFKLFCKYRTSLTFPALGATVRNRATGERVHDVDYSVVHDVQQSFGLSNPLKRHLVCIRHEHMDNISHL